jgi:hypothetical protein
LPELSFGSFDCKKLEWWINLTDEAIPFDLVNVLRVVITPLKRQPWYDRDIMCARVFDGINDFWKIIVLYTAYCWWSDSVRIWKQANKKPCSVALANAGWWW